jgi:hypothetical protein
MAITKTDHIIEEIDGVRCSVVEKNVSPERLAFIRPILEFNGLEVKITQSPPPKTPPAPPATEGAPAPPSPSPAPETFTVGVTDKLFNIMLAIYARRIKTPDGSIISPHYWNQDGEITGKWYWK